MENSYLVSVIIPVYNTGNYLKKSVDSVRSQSLRDIEIILVENGSTDNSAQICDEYAALDSRVKALHIPVADASTARNEGIAISSAPYIGFIDSDDYIAPEMYRVLLDNLEKYKADISMCNYRCGSDENGQIDTKQDTGNVTIYTGMEAAKGVLKEIFSNSPCDKLYRRELFDALPFPQGVYYEDHYMMLEWLKQCRCVVSVDTSYYYYWQRQGSTCRAFNPIKGYHFFLADYQRWEFVNRHKLLNVVERQAFINTIVYRCYFHFKKTLSVVKPENFREEIADMRNKQLTYYQKEWRMLSFKNNLRLLKVTYAWAIYYWISFGFKKRDWKRS